VADLQIRYCTTSDGVRIAYTTDGQGPPLVVMSPIWTSFSLLHELPNFEEFQRLISAGRTLVRLDNRGVGLSQRDVAEGTVASFARDLVAVLDALGIARASVIASGPVGPAAIILSQEQPERLAALVLVSSWPRTPESSRPALTSLASLANVNWEMGARMIAGWNLRRSAEEGSRLASIYLRSTSGQTVARYIEANLHSDESTRLGQIQARTLVVHSEEDSFYPFAEAQLMAARIPNAGLLPVKGNSSITSLGDSMEMVADAIIKFLDEDPDTRRLSVEKTDIPSSGLRTVLFTDLVGHTEMMQRLGDEKGRDVLREHERITRGVLKANGGTEVKTMGDGFMASFGSVTKAVECAVALQRAFADREGEPLNVRVGLNAGEPIEEDGDLFGATVILASRIAAKAEGGEILVADTVRGLCSGKGFLFADRGEFVAKGIEEPVRISEVNWRHA